MSESSWGTPPQQPHDGSNPPAASGPNQGAPQQWPGTQSQAYGQQGVPQGGASHGVPHGAAPQGPPQSGYGPQSFPQGGAQQWQGAPQGYPQPGYGQPPYGAAQPTAPLSTSWPSFALMGAALLGLISVFLPIANIEFFGESGSVSWFDLKDLAAVTGQESAAANEGVVLLIVTLLVAAAALASALLRKGWARILAGVLGILGGIIMMIDGFSNISHFGSHEAEMAGVSPGIGLWLLALTGIATAVVAVLVMVIRPKAAPYR